MSDRLALLRDELAKCNLTAFFISSLPNLRSLTGFSGSNAFGLVTEDRFIFITDKRYQDQVHREVTGAEIFIGGQDLLQPLKTLRLFSGQSRLGFEAHHLTFRDFSRLKETFPDVRLVATENLIERLTTRKLPGEVEKFRRACALTVAVWEHLLPKIRPGLAELEVSAEISYLAKKLGAGGDAFEPIVASGWRSALPHGIATDKRLEIGDPVVIDFGCRFGGLNADITRTIFIGRPGEKLLHMYNSVKSALEKALEAIEANMLAADLDSVAREVLNSRGYEDAFTHSLGHGLGYEVHSLPRIGQGSRDRLTMESVFTIEPGVYIPEVGGIRIEDDVYLGPRGAEVLTPISRELIVIE